MTEKVFTNPEWEKFSKKGGIPHFGYYRRYRLSDGTVNPEFRVDKISGLILDLKQKKESALNYFYAMLENEFCRPVTICVVPSHEAGDTNNSGIAELARRLAADGRIDKVDFILRKKDIEKLATGGRREIDIHRESLSANSKMSVSGDVILLMDDITTTGASLKACEEILLANGATRVAMFALGQSI